MNIITPGKEKDSSSCTTTIGSTKKKLMSFKQDLFRNKTKQLIKNGNNISTPPLSSPVPTVPLLMVSTRKCSIGSGSYTFKYQQQHDDYQSLAGSTCLVSVSSNSMASSSSSSLASPISTTLGSFHRPTPINTTTVVKRKGSVKINSTFSNDSPLYSPTFSIRKSFSNDISDDYFNKQYIINYRSTSIYNTEDEYDHHYHQGPQDHQLESSDDLSFVTTLNENITEFDINDISSITEGWSLKDGLIVANTEKDSDDEDEPIKQEIVNPS